MHQGKIIRLSGIFAVTLAIAACGSNGSAPAAEEAPEVTEEAAAEPAAEETGTATSDSGPALAAPVKDPIRSPGGMETKCLAKVNEMTGGGVIGTRMIEEAESGVMIYVNVEGAEAPWQCFGSRDGTLGEVYYGGSEGDL